MIGDFVTVVVALRWVLIAIVLALFVLGWIDAASRAASANKLVDELSNELDALASENARLRSAARQRIEMQQRAGRRRPPIVRGQVIR